MMCGGMAEVVAYHVDTTAQLAPGQTIVLQVAPAMPAGGPDLSQDWSDGFSSHGIRYVTANILDGSSAPEWIFELVRRAEFEKDLISRFEAVFAMPTLAAARAFRHKYVKNLAAPIVRVQGERAHRANMALVELTFPLATTMARAREYWRGDPGIALPPVWELLLRPPVSVLGRVAEDVPSDEPDGEADAVGVAA
jgi:hypothetical protein